MDCPILPLSLSIRAGAAVDSLSLFSLVSIVSIVGVEAFPYRLVEEFLCLFELLNPSLLPVQVIIPSLPIPLVEVSDHPRSLDFLL